jgi:hypothetical protein
MLIDERFQDGKTLVHISHVHGSGHEKCFNLNLHKQSTVYMISIIDQHDQA